MKHLFISIVALCAYGIMHGQEKSSILMGRYESKNVFGTTENAASVAQQERFEVKRWRVTLDAGYSYVTAEIVDGLDSQVREIVSKVRNGFYYGGDVHYLFPGEFGLGMILNGRYYSASMYGAKDTKNTFTQVPRSLTGYFQKTAATPGSSIYH